jgi:cytoplasmic iron level regulating protein YaaA (DUF328/UPF0246 family)
MIVLLSSAKTLDLESPWRTPPPSCPEFLDRALPLVASLRRRSVAQLGAVLGVSPKLAQLNADRLRAFTTPFTVDNARPALCTYQGDVYRPIHEERYTPEQWRFAQRTVRIVSGLFGVVRPLDLIQPYRLEMAAPLSGSAGGAAWADLYAYWSAAVTAAINRDAQAAGGPVVNLASQEYARAVDAAALRTPMLAVTFKETRGEKPRVIGLLAKRARGVMTEFIITRQVDDPAVLKTFREDGYRFTAGDSSDEEWVFIRT